MRYCFRIKLRIGHRVGFETSDDELELASCDGERVTLRPSADGVHLRDTEWLSVRGESYETREQAQEAAAIWGTRLRLAFSLLRMGADFGLRAPRGGLTEAGLKMVEESSGRRALNDVHGVTVFECDPPPVFASVSAEGKVGKPVQRFLGLLSAAAETDPTMSAKEELAFDLYSASFFERSADARFLMLMMALETLIEQEPRGETVAAHVARLVVATKEADDIPQTERESLIGSLRGLEQESVGQAGRRLAESLGEREYMGEAPRSFFNRCYELRSALVHGHYPRPEAGEVGTRAANLEGFVGDLLGAALLDVATEA